MIRNSHERILPCSTEQAAYLLDNLASPREALWPVGRWPRMRLSAGLNPGSYGGHGPIGYFVESYNPGREVQFRFTAPTGFSGYHRLELLEHPEGCILKHDMQVHTNGLAWLKWQLVLRPLHDALLEDALDRGGAHFGLAPRNRYSPYVRLLRWLLRWLS
ncbi:SRPBCC family protein [bacterium]|nr:SRPBCC family protein [bacterium]